MVITAIILTAVALVFTGLLPAMKGSYERLAGPDRAGAGISFVILLFPRWVCLAVALGCCVGAGAFNWLSVPAGAQMFLVLTGHVILGAGSLINMGAALDRGSLGRVAMIPPMVMPILVMGIAFLGLMEPAPRLVLALLIFFTAGLDLTFPVISLIGGIASSATNARQAEAADVERRAKYAAERMADLKALPADAHLYQWIQYTYANEPDEVLAFARESILRRPNLAQELSESLRNKASFEAVWFMSQHMERVPEEVAPALVDGIMAMAEHMRKESATAEEPYLNQYNGECERILLVVGKVETTGTDFSAAIRAVYEALGSGKQENSPGGRAALLSYLKRG